MLGSFSSFLSRNIRKCVMADRASRRRSHDESFKAFVLDQLSRLDRLSCRSMFGGYGLSQGESFFGIPWKGKLYFKTDETTQAAYREFGMKPFRPHARQMLTGYYEVPVEILEDQEQLGAWAVRSIDCARTVARSRHRP